MRYSSILTIAALLPLSATTTQSTRQPVFDAHLHSPFSVENVRAMQRAMDSLNVTRAVFIGSSGQLDSIPTELAGKVLPALTFPCDQGRMPNAGAPCYPAPGQVFPDVNWVRAQVKAGRVKVFGEIGAQYLGIAPNDARLEPLFI